MWYTFSKVGVVGLVIVVAALLLGDFVIVSPNRLMAGQPMSIFEVLTTRQWLVVIVLVAAVTGLSLQPNRVRLHVSAVLVLLLVLLLIWYMGSAALGLLKDDDPFTRISMGSSLWLVLLGLFIVFCDILQRAAPGAIFKLFLFFIFMAGLTWTAASGVLDALSLVVEFKGRSERFYAEFTDHIFITGLSVGCALVIGLPLGVVVFKSARSRTAVFSMLNIIQTVPSLALFGLLIAPLAFLSNELPLLKKMGIHGIGWAPAVIALTLYALLPIVRNTFSGFAMVGRDVLESGRGMGMSRMQLFFRVELPLAAPIILGGLRIAIVQTIGNTAVAALIGAGGFGIFIFQGLGQSAIDLVLLGAIPTILLALVADYLFQALIRVATPRGLSGAHDNF
ncbi:MAG: ABC transporter permease [Desulforhopalus sp.]